MECSISYFNLGLKIKEVRLSKGYTQDYLAEKVGCNTSHISNIENNHTKVSLNVLVAIANALETTLDYLLESEYLTKPTGVDKTILEYPLDLKEKLTKIADIIK